MEHEEAIHSQAAARYAATELAPEEQDAFEDHFFGCRQCAEDVRYELTFAANARAVLREPAATSRRAKARGWLAWLHPQPVLAISLAANALLAAGLAAVLIGGVRQDEPGVLPAYYAPGPTRGSEDARVHSLPSGATSFILQIPPPDPGFTAYTWEILDSDGRRELTGQINLASSREGDVYLQIPVTGLRRGTHTVQVRENQAGTIISRSKFEKTRRRRES